MFDGERGARNSKPIFGRLGKQFLYPEAKFPFPPLGTVLLWLTSPFVAGKWAELY